MSQTSPIEWDIASGDGIRPDRAFAWTLIDQQVVIYAFALTTSGVPGLIGLRTDPLPSHLAGGTPRALADHVERLTEAWCETLPNEAGEAIRSRHLRLITNYTGLLAQARDQLSDSSLVYAVTFGRPPVKGEWTDSEVHLGRLLSQYVGPTAGARRRWAAAIGVPETKAKNMIADARRRGIWLTTGVALLGQLNPAMREELVKRYGADPDGWKVQA